jgi:ribosome maturation factor RimP
LLRQYRKNIGREVSVVMNDGTRIAGKLAFADELGIEVAEQKKEKKIVTEVSHRLEFVNIKETKEIIKF